ncbi:short chain dehydrogenase, putative [Perkinsus marinus ATCC 50983]|uniref:3-dehydrosphinganine reductase n=1 Tax=Perkinsus marinus (strain ATCC 50983 / TXsc) TaxID=423536 RepID=C5LDI9_PERM5|nr:short chain dehydrogenase, putative [Perkinsus marinus ATCC 50983]EER05321.1 short chain dehydrogenase, putative [Perkinsus marinus ATCC 50983]|eukprot:XP_002773505.1 short chain dehydrogenase, putative [Perkinsus marinus ATCC 50983]
MWTDWLYGFGGLILLITLISYIFKRGKYQSVEGLHVCIPGGSSGIGLAVAKRCAADGAKRVTIIARRMEVLEKAAKEIREVNPACDVALVSCDITDPKKVDQMFVKDIDADEIDWLINCAGMSLPGLAEETTVKDIMAELNVNYLGSVFMARKVLPSMKEKGRGRIAFVSSQAAQIGVYGLASYSGSKFAIRGYAETLRQETEVHNVQVSIVYPPDTRTPGFEHENTRKPEITKLISSTSGLVEPDTVAEALVHGVSRGDFNIWCGFEGLGLSQISAGMTPPNSLLHGVFQALGASLLKLVSFLVVMQLDWVVGANEKKPYKRPVTKLD